MDATQLRRQLEARLQSLREAGIEWLPQGPPLEPSPALGPSRTLEQPTLPGLGDAAPAPSAAAPIEQRRMELRQLADEVRGCTRCPELCSSRTQTVFGQGEVGV